MRISDCAELTGTTVRTIRYYHQIGLLPVPERRFGYRDYDLRHIARILRIRWLADAGLSLDAITGLVGEEAPTGRATTLRELHATADSMDERITDLTEQRRRIAALVTMAEQGREFTPLPDSFGEFYQRVAERLDDPDALEALAKEQRLAEMFAQRGMLPHPEALERVMGQLSDYDVERVAGFYTDYVRIPRLPADEATRLADDLLVLLRSWMDENPELTRATIDLLPTWSTSAIGFRVMEGFMTLMATDARQARLLRTILREILHDPPETSPATDDTTPSSQSDDQPSAHIRSDA